MTLHSCHELAMPAALLFEPVHDILAVFLRGALEHYRASICPDDQSRLHAFAGSAAYQGRTMR